MIEDAAADGSTVRLTPLRTAEQVARHRDESPDELLACWASLAPPFEAEVTARSVVPAFLDVLSPEHDVRGALDAAGGRDDGAVQFAAERLAELDDLPVRIELVADPSATPSPHDGDTWVLRATPFEVLRFRLGRRTRDQVRALRWSADPDPTLDRLFVFGPAAEPLSE